MPSFDIVSKAELHEVNNAVEQASKELANRFDFKGTNASISLNKTVITLVAPSHFQLKQMDEILRNKMAKRNVDIRCLDYRNISTNLNEVKQEIHIKQGMDGEMAKKIVKIIKEAAFKVQPTIQGDQVRVTSKKRDDLQAVIAKLKADNIDIPLQFVNFRD